MAPSWHRGGAPHGHLKHKPVPARRPPPAAFCHFSLPSEAAVGARPPRADFCTSTSHQLTLSTPPARSAITPIPTRVPASVTPPSAPPSAAGALSLSQFWPDGLWAASGQACLAACLCIVNASAAYPKEQGSWYPRACLSVRPCNFSHTCLPPRTRSCANQPSFSHRNQAAVTTKGTCHQLIAILTCINVTRIPVARMPAGCYQVLSHELLGVVDVGIFKPCGHCGTDAWQICQHCVRQRRRHKLAVDSCGRR